MFKMIKEEKTKKDMPLPTTEVEYMPKEIIPPLRILNIIERLNNIITGLEGIGLSQVDVNEIKKDLTRIESSIENIEISLEKQIENSLIYKT